MTDNDLVSYPRTGRDGLLAAVQTPQSLADYLFNLEGFIATFTGADPTPHSVLAPITFLEGVTFAGGVTFSGGGGLVGCVPIDSICPPSGTLTVNGNLTVTGAETIDLTETVLGLLTVNVAAGNIAEFQVGGVTKAHIDANGTYQAGGSSGYGLSGISIDAGVVSYNVTLQDGSTVRFTSELVAGYTAGAAEVWTLATQNVGFPLATLYGGAATAGTIQLWGRAGTDYAAINILGGLGGAFQAIADPSGDSVYYAYSYLRGGQAASLPIQGYNGAAFVTVATLTQAATPTFDLAAGRLTGGFNLNAQTLTGNAILTGFPYALSGTTLATGGTILQAFSDGGGVHIMDMLLAGTVLSFDSNSTIPISKNPTYQFGKNVNVVFPIGEKNRFAVFGSTGGLSLQAADSTDPVTPNGLFSLNNTLDDGTTGAATFAGLLTMSAGANLTGTLAWVNAQTVTLSLTAQTIGAATLTVPNFAGVSDTFAFLTLAQTFAGVKTFSATAAFTNASPFSMTNAQVVTVTLTAQTVGASTLTVPNFAGASDTFAFLTLTQTLANKTLGAGTLLGVSLLPTADNTYRLGSAALRITGVSVSSDFSVYAAASDAFAAAVLGPSGLLLGPGGAGAGDTHWQRQSVGVIGGAHILTSGGGTAPTAVVVPASGTAYTPSATQNTVVMSSGGVVSGIAINGVATGLTSGTFYLKASDTITWTYTGAPSAVQMNA
ncbi:MAG: hypothetical protein KGJ23_08350 [Euryarchaeota archaeon]|nr:hypothetical protein [Euryarchaeota archaeon]MDE1836613.1 hypothetical protein [Euryarchaeota archaeon]MDE1879192.1 hypothetical protein [Euryarchaeota archaeon]MDE2044583.1 hypothetical protein [Thermoplasmata archaeon]